MTEQPGQQAPYPQGQYPPGYPPQHLQGYPPPHGQPHPAPPYGQPAYPPPGYVQPYPVPMQQTHVHQVRQVGMSVTKPAWTVGDICWIFFTAGLAWPFIWMKRRARTTVTRHR